VALPDEENRTDEATVALPAQRAEETPEAVTGDEPTVALPAQRAEEAPGAVTADEPTVALPAQRAEETPGAVTADEPTARLPELLAAPAGQPAADDGETTPLPGLSAEAANGEATTTPPEPAATAEPETAPDAAEATVSLPATPCPEEPTTAQVMSPKTTDPNGSMAGSAAPKAKPATPDTTAATEAASTAADGAAPAPADATVAIPPVPATRVDGSSPEADPTVAIPHASPPADGTVVLPPAVPARGPAPASHPGQVLLGRRRLLLAGAGMAAAAVVGGIAVAAAAGHEPNVAGSPVPPGSPATATTTRPREPEAASVPVPAPRKPIFTLSDYRRETGAGPFPADAIALTIDDGPHPIWTPKILQLLDQYHVPAMFCMIGNQVLGHENIAKMVTTAGHQLANHTWSHPVSLEKRTGETVHSEILRAQEKIYHTTGQAPKFFRSPGGGWSPVVLQQAAAAGLLPLDWTNDPRDWAQPGVGKIEKTMLAARAGQILLCHDGGGDRSQTYNALKAVLPQLKARGLRFVTL
jgi:peptidoglycan/xylan/chitin deacetylase (PgdA/CDA1 family)